MAREVADVESLASNLDCKVSFLPSSYLGLPLGATFKATSVWDSVVECFERWLSGWKKGYLSKGGRLTRLCSTLGSLPTYYMSLFRIPVLVANRLEKIQRDFLWARLGDEKNTAFS